MKGMNFGEFEELVLLIIVVLIDGVYSVVICDELEKYVECKVCFGVVYVVLNWLEIKGYLSS